MNELAKQSSITTEDLNALIETGSKETTTLEGESNLNQQQNLETNPESSPNTNNKEEKDEETKPKEESP